ncbi:MAG: AAA family ATPase [Bifidobacteriaceae bacterium]|nr:AAA family ATPase [Bifidobacteriaceae bacterium]MCI1978171.1 AAA family ATPase [Bifidobacteriaceae bacterium]
MVDFLPLGVGHTLFSGDGALGKSSVAQRLAYRVATGTSSGAWSGEAHGVLFILSEDGGGDVKNAMSAYGMNDTSNVYVYTEATDPTLEDAEAATVRLPDDIPYLREMCRRLDIRLIIIDALSDSMAGMNLNRHADVGAVVTELGHWSQNDDVLVIGIHHNGKSMTRAKLSPVGSEAFTNKSRTLVSFEKTDDDHYVFQLTKANRIKGNPSYEYHFAERTVFSDEGPTPVGIIDSITPTDMDVDAIRASKAEFAAQTEEEGNPAREFILDYLNEQGGESPAKDILREGRAQGFNETELKNARGRSRDPRIVTRKSGGTGKGWVWAIEEGSQSIISSPAPSQPASMTPLTSLSAPNDLTMTPLSENTKGIMGGNKTPLSQYPDDVDFTALTADQLDALSRRPGLWPMKVHEERNRRLRAAA